MYHGFTYEATLAASLKAQWKLDDVFAADQELDFSRNFMPDALCRASEAAELSDDEKRTPNHICANQYLVFFGRVEEFVLPFVLDHARPMLREDDFRVRALINFANEEAKHIHLFNRFHAAFVRGFPVECMIIGPPEKLPEKVLSHRPLAVAMYVLMTEWMTQAHYLETVKDDGGIDPLFKSMLKHHWMEEAQHAKLDTLIVEALAEGQNPQTMGGVMREFFQICAYMDNSLKAQAVLNVETLQRAIGRKLERPAELAGQQYRAARWTYLGSALSHERFKVSPEQIAPRGAQRVAELVAQIQAADTKHAQVLAA